MSVAVMSPAPAAAMHRTCQRSNDWLRITKLSSNSDRLGGASDVCSMFERVWRVSEKLRLSCPHFGCLVDSMGFAGPGVFLRGTSCAFIDIQFAQPRFPRRNHFVCPIVCAKARIGNSSHLSNSRTTLLQQQRKSPNVAGAKLLMEERRRHLAEL